MSEEDLNRKLEFIVEQLGQTVVSVQTMQQKHDDLFDKFDKRMSRLEGAFVGMYNTVSKQSEQIEDLRKSVEVLRDDGRETRERLDIFIVMLERYISRNENGNTTDLPDKQ